MSRALSILLSLLLTLPVAAEPPNIVLVILDDVGWRDLGCYGSDLHETPHLDRMASEGIRFTNSYAASHVCSPTRASILTGKHPARLRLTDYIPGEDNGPLRSPVWTRWLKPGQPTLGNLLKSAGYATGYFGKWHLNRDKNYRPGRSGDPGSHGFDSVLTTVRPGDGDPPQPDGHHARKITDAALAFVAAQRGPFLCVVSHHLVHRPYRSTRQVELPQPEPTLHRDPIYAAMMNDLDEQIGRLMACLRKYDLEHDTLVLITSDNGGYPGRDGAGTSNAPLRGGKGTAYEGGIRVPTILRWPAQLTPDVSDLPIISTDYLPTLLAAAGVGLSPREPVDGINLLPILRGQTRNTRAELYWHYPHYHALGARPHSAVRFENWKLIEFLEDGHCELYDLQEDPGEAFNLYDKQRDIGLILKAQLTGWRKNIKAQNPRPPGAPPAILMTAIGVVIAGIILLLRRR